MMSMNMIPPRATEPRKAARLPTEKARVLNRCSRNMGSLTRVSTTRKSPSRTIPSPMPVQTQGLDQPMGCPP
jgi:hypothetical protein